MSVYKRLTPLVQLQQRTLCLKIRHPYLAIASTYTPHSHYALLRKYVFTISLRLYDNVFQFLKVQWLHFTGK